MNKKIFNNGFISKKVISLFMVAIMMFLSVPIYADDNPYLNPYNNIQTLENYENVISEISQIEYLPNPEYRTLIKSQNFNDVFGSDKVLALKAQALKITNGIGGNKFSPNTKMSNIGALVMIMRAIGEQEPILERLRNENPNISESKLMPMFYDQIVDVAKSRSIVSSNDSFDYFASIDEKRAKEWVSNALVAPINETTRENISNLASSSGISDKNDIISRIQFTRFLMKAIEYFPQKTGVSTQNVFVTGYDKSKPEQRIISLKNTNAELIELKLNNVGENKEGIAFYSNSRFMNDNSIKIGDELELLIKENIILMAFEAPKNSVKHSALNSISLMDGVIAQQGQVKSNVVETIDTKDEKKIVRKIIIESVDDRMFDIRYSLDLKINKENGFLILNGNRFVNPDTIKKDDLITVYLKDNKVLYVVIGKDNSRYIEGNINSIDISEDNKSAKITVFGIDDRLYTFDIDDEVGIYVNFTKADVKELKVGAYASLRAVFGRVVNIFIDSYRPEAGYIPKRGRIEFAKVLNLSNSRVNIEIIGTASADSSESSSVKKKSYFIVDKSTKIIKNRSEISINEIKKGDHLRLFYDDIYTFYPSRIEVEGKNRQIYKIIRAKTENFNQFNNMITVKDLYQLENGRWQRQANPYHQSFKISLDAEIFDDSEKYNLKIFNKEMTDRIAYLVVANSFGADEIVKMVFKTGSERLYNESIANYNPIDRTLNLRDRRSLQYNDGTIFIEDSRLVSDIALRSGANVIVVGNLSDDYDNLKLAVISENDSKKYSGFYIGALDTVDKYKISLENYTKSNNYSFDKVNTGNIDFRLSDETIIVDLDKEERITPMKLFNDSYSKEENYHKYNFRVKYKRYYVMAIVEDSEVKVMLLRHKGIFKDDNIDDKAFKESQIPDMISKSLENVVYTRGVINSINDTWNRVSLKNSYNYQNAIKEWRPNSAETSVELTSALIIKDGIPVSISDLEKGDKLYIIRVGYNAVYVSVTK